MRKKIKKPATEKAINILLSKLEKVGDEENAIKMLENSILNNWQDIYPLKEGNNGNSNNTRYSRKQEDKHSKKPDYTKGFDDWN